MLATAALRRLVPPLRPGRYAIHSFGYWRRNFVSLVIERSLRAMSDARDALRGLRRCRRHAIDELPQVVDFVGGKGHLTRFRNHCEWIVEDFGTSELDDSVGDVLHIDIGRFGNHLREMLVGTRIIVRPTRSIEFSASGVFPTRND